MKNSINTRIVSLYVFVCFIAIVVVSKILIIQKIDQEITSVNLPKLFKIKASRGNIFSDDGSLLAISMPLYNVHMDLSVVDDKIFSSQINNLSISLAQLFGDRSASDYEKYLREIRVLKYELGVPSFKDESKKNLLIIGNSHGRDLFNILKLNESSFLDYEFSILDTKISCLKYINNNKLCDKTLSKLQEDILNQSNIILISTRYDDEDLLELKDIIQKLSTDNKKVILASNRPEFYFSNNNLTIIDEFFLQNKRLPNNDERLELKEKYFLSIKPKLKKINTFIEQIAKDNQIDFIDTKELICSDQKRTCEFLTNSNSKLMYDSSHFTVEGAKYLGTKVKELKWF